MPRKPKPQIPTPTATPFDLASRYAADTVDVVIMDPADLSAKIDTGFRITIRSLYSDAAREAANAEHARLKIVDGKIDASDADFAHNLFEQTIAVTVGWNLVENGVALACTPDEVRRIYGTPRTAWVQKQVQATYLDLGRFFGAPKTA